MDANNMDKPIPVLIKEIRAGQKSGRLQINGKSFQKTLFFKEGKLAFARTTVIQERIGEILFKLGMINQAQFWNIHKMLEGRHEKIGTILVEQNILARPDVQRALEIQIRTIGLSVFSVHMGEWNFAEQKVDLPRDFIFSIPLDDIISKGVNFIPNIAYYQSLFMDRSPKILLKNENFPEILTGEDILFLEHLEKLNNASCSQIMQKSLLPEEKLWNRLILLYLLNVIGFVEVADTENVDKNIELLITLSEMIGSRGTDFYSILGVKPDSGEEDIKSAYFGLARRLHPDRISMAPDPDIREKANLVFAAINKAFETLNDPVKKEKYDSSGLKETENQSLIHENLTEKARILYRKAKTLYNQQRFRESAAIMEEAVRIDQTKASYYLLLGSSQVYIPPLRRAAEMNLKKALELDSWNADAYASLGLLFMEEKLLRRAMGFFRKALSLDPEHKLATKKMGQLSPEKNRKKSSLWPFKKK